MTDDPALSSGRAVSLSVAVEASGEECSQIVYGDDWACHAEFFAADHAKVLVRDNPSLDPGDRERQASHLHHYCTAAESRHRISCGCLDYRSYYLQAPDGVLDGQADPEFW